MNHTVVKKQSIIGKSQRIKLLVALCFTCFSTSFIGSSLNIALPVISREFNISTTILPWIITSSLLTSSVFLLPAGRLADILGHRRIYISGIIIFTLASLSSALSNSTIVLIISQAAIGIGIAAISAPSVAMITLNFSTQERGKALGIYLAVIYVGLTLGPSVGGVLTQYVGWRSLFSISVLTGLLSLFLIWQMKKFSDMTTGGKLDIVGGLLCVLSITFLVIGTALLPEVNGFWLISAGTIGIVIFIFWETHVKSPLLNIKLFIHNRTFALSNLVAFIIYSATWATSYLLNLHLQYIKGFTPGQAGLILLVMPAIQAIFSPISGHLSDRFNIKYLLSIGMSLTTVGLCLLLFLGDHTPLIQILASLILLGLGLGLFVSPNTNAIMGSVANPEYGIASATLSMMRQLGMTFSMVIVTVIFSLYIGQADIIPEFYPSFLTSTKTALSVFAILNFTGIFAVFFLSTKKLDNPAEGGKESMERKDTN